jgi:nucleoside-diphosphate-sugar epimerase
LPHRVVVLGASGFIGRRVVDALGSGNSSYRPVAVSRRASQLGWGEGVDVLDADAVEPPALEQAIAGAHAIVNCMAGLPASIMSVSQNLFSAAAAMSPRPRVVNMGSLAAYGSATGLVDESAELRGDLDEYSEAKARSDRLAAQYDFVVTLRPGIVYGPGSPWWSDRIARLLTAGRLGNLGSHGTGICNLIYVDDVAAAVVKAVGMTPSPQRAFNLASSAGLTWNEYFSQYAAALSALPVRRISARRLNVETRIMSPALKLLEMALYKPAWSRWNPWPPLRPWLPQLCERKIQMVVADAERILEMQWTPLGTGLQRTADWFRRGGRTAITGQ